MKLKNLFTSGKMNKDLDERLVPKGEYRDALNVKVANSNGSGVGAIENSLSNEALSSASFGANASCVGAVSDDKNNQIYWFVKSDSGSYLMEYSASTGDVDFVLTDTRQGSDSVLNLSKAHLITGVNVVIDAEQDKKYIYWTDGLNPPRRVEVSQAKGYSINGFDDADISVIKATPRKEPRIVGIEGDNPEQSNMRDEFFSFAYRYVYSDDQFSALSPFSDFAFKPGKLDYSSIENSGMVNMFTSVEVFVNVGDARVSKIELYAKESESQNLYLIHTIDKDAEQSPYIDNTEIPYLFKNDKLSTVLSETQFNRIYDNVPLTAKTQDMIGNRLIYGNYEENYDLIDSNEDGISFNLSIDKISTELSDACETSNSYTITRVGSNTGFYYTNCDEESVLVKLDPDETITICGYNLGNVTDNTSQYTKVDNGPCGVLEPKPTLRSNRTYDVGMVYFDKYGRKSTVITGLSNSIYFNHYYNETRNQLRVNISHNAPYWADRYKFAVKENVLEYYTMRTKGPFYRAKEDNVNYYYIKFSQTELNKAADGDTLILKNNGDSHRETLYKYYVVGVETKEENFIGTGTQEAGAYLKVKGNTTILEDTLTEPYMIIFESTQEKSADSAYYEVPGTFDIVDGLHKGLEQDQTITQPAQITLNAYNAYCFGDGSESNRIEDSISGSKIALGVRVNAEIDDYRAKKRVASLTYSDVFESTTNYNGLNQFNLSLANYKDMDPIHGSVTFLHSRDNDLITFQENKVQKVLFDKSVLYNADGTGNISQNINVLGQQIAYKGEYGISYSPESFKSHGHDIFFADERRGSICRLTENGIFPISDYGMQDWFNDNLSVSNQTSTIGGYDPINDHYVVSIKDGFVEWREDDYACEGGLTEWREDTYSCQQEGDPTTTTTTAAPTTSAPTTTAAPTTAAPTTTTTAAPTTSTTTDGGPSTTSTTTIATTSTTVPTTPPPTTQAPVYYSLTRCSDSSSGWRTGQTIQTISLSVNDRVEDAGSVRYIVAGTTTSGTSVGTVTDTGLQGCLDPTTSTTTIVTTSTTVPTTTTAAPYNYYAVRGCPGSFYENRDMYIRTLSTLPDANGNTSTSSTISWNGQSFYAYSTLNQSQWSTGSGDLASITYSGSVGTGCPAATTTTAAPTTSAPTTQPPATTTTQPPVTTQAPTTTTVAPTTIPTTSTTAAPTTVPTTTTTAAPITTTTTVATTTTTTAAPATTTTTTAITTYAGARTSGQTTSDDACNLFAFDNVWFATPTPEDGARVYTDSTAQTPFNGGDQWYGIDMDGNGVTFSTRITSFGYMYSTTECLGGGGF